ncbi:hypothetical protein [Halomarina litorea]|uniref:hypothetical protein n=1 Tax=Halomarina litorea TaxID=2961595 RepID=UPI0020C2CA61|nr:hypothetical protein [Halomarina sp. BCD28]
MAATESYVEPPGDLRPLLDVAAEWETSMFVAHSESHPPPRVKTPPDTASMTTIRGSDDQFEFDRVLEVRPEDVDDITGWLADHLEDGTLVQMHSGVYRATRTLKHTVGGDTIGIEVVGDEPVEWRCHDGTELVVSQLGYLGAGWAVLDGLFVDGPIEISSEGDANCPGFAIWHAREFEVNGVHIVDASQRETLYFRFENHSPADHDQPSYIRDCVVETGMEPATSGRNSAFGFFSEGMEGPTIMADCGVRASGGHGYYLANSSNIHVLDSWSHNTPNTGLRAPTRSYVEGFTATLDEDFHHDRDAVGIALNENRGAFEDGAPIGGQTLVDCTVEHSCRKDGVLYSIKFGHDVDGMDAGDVDICGLTVEHEREDAPAMWVGANYSGTARVDGASAINGTPIRELADSEQVRRLDHHDLQFVEAVDDPLQVRPVTVPADDGGATPTPDDAGDSEQGGQSDTPTPAERRAAGEVDSLGGEHEDGDVLRIVAAAGSTVEYVLEIDGDVFPGDQGTGEHDWDTTKRGEGVTHVEGWSSDGRDDEWVIAGAVLSATIVQGDATVEWNGETVDPSTLGTTTDEPAQEGDQTGEEPAQPPGRVLTVRGTDSLSGRRHYRFRVSESVTPEDAGSFDQTGDGGVVGHMQKGWSQEFRVQGDLEEVWVSDGIELSIDGEFVSQK